MAMKNFVTGEVLTESDLDIFCVNTIFVRKSADESVTSSTVLQNDNELLVSVAANSTYEITMMIRYDGDIAGDLKSGFTFPSGLTMGFATSRLASNATVTNDDAVLYNIQTDSIVAGCLGAGTDAALFIHGLVMVSSTAGTLQFQWAQLTADSTATRVRANSFICLRRVD